LVFSFAFSTKDSIQKDDSLKYYISQQITHLSGHYVLPTIVCLKQAVLGLLRILRKNKNPFICRREFMWAVQDSNLRPPGC